MASGAQVSEQEGGFGGELEVASSNQVTGERGDVAEGGEIGVASSIQETGLASANKEPQGVGGEIGVASVDQIIQEPEDNGGEIRVASASHVKEEAGASGGESRATSVNLETEEAGASGYETRVTSVNHETEEAGALCGEIGPVYVNHATDEGVLSGEIRESSVNHETEEERTLGGEIRAGSVNHLTGEAEVTGSEIELASVCKVNGEPVHVSGEIEVNTRNKIFEPGSGNIKIEMASEREVNGEPGGGNGDDGEASVMQVNEKPKEEGQICGIEIASANLLNGVPGGAGGESDVPFVDQVNVKPGGADGESDVASVNLMNVQPGCDGDEFEMASPNKVNQEQGGRSGQIGLASANQMNVEPGGGSGEIRLASAVLVNEESGGYIEFTSSSQVNGEPGGAFGLASASQVDREPGGGGGEVRVTSVNQVSEISRRVGGELGVREKHRWVDTKVYRRRSKGEKKECVLSKLTMAPAPKTLICNGKGSQNNKIIEVNTRNSDKSYNNDRMDGNGVDENAKVSSVPSSVNKPKLKLIQPATVGEVIRNQELSSAIVDGGGATCIPVDPPVINGAERPHSASDRKLKIYLASSTKVELRELKRKLESELFSVRKTVKNIDGGRKEVVPEFSAIPVGGKSNGFATRVYSGTRSLGHVPYKPNIRPFNQLRVSVVENGHGMIDSNEREKRTPKANQFYRNSEFLLANDKFPPAESNKKSKSIGKKSSEVEFGFGVGSKVYKSCSALLEILMKHKHSWVFNAPVDVNGLGLHDYFLIVKTPMDLGTVKAKLIKYWYKSPMEFAGDVRLTFHNAMLYNPKGHDVHIMAETLLKIFEGKWPDIEVKYLKELRMAVEPDMGYPTPTSRITNPFQSSAFPPIKPRVFNRSESMPHPVNPKPRTLTPAPSLRQSALKKPKPKAKDINKRDMTYDEKQKLSTNLQSLPPDKQDGIIQIIKKRSTAVSQNDDEIEVYIDNVDTESLWELDRFVTNYKKNLNKNRRKAELASQMQAEVRQAAEKITTQRLPPKEATPDYGNATLSLPPHQNDPAANASGSSSSSSSSSSGSSSSDSDSDSSSEESDGGHSPGT